MSVQSWHCFKVKKYTKKKGSCNIEEFVFSNTFSILIVNDCEEMIDLHSSFSCVVHT